MQPILEDVARRFYIHLIASFGVGFIIFLWGYGLYAMFLNFKTPGIAYVLLMFTIFLIFCTILLEHRGVKMPYLLAGGAFLSLILTFMTISVVNGLLWINDNHLPPIDTFLMLISISTIAGFILIKLFTFQKKY